MAGKRLIDAAKLFDASRSVASQHLRIRQEQWAAWTETSTLAKAVKSQTDRVTVTVQAARELGKRFGEEGPTWKDDIGRRKENVAQRVREDAAASRSDEQSHDPIINSSSANADVDDGTLSALRRRELQRIAERQIPASSADGQTSSLGDLRDDTFTERSDYVSQDLSSLPRMKVPKHLSDTQGGDGHVQDAQLNQDVYYTRATQAPISEDRTDDTTEGLNADLVSSPRISKMLGQAGAKVGNPYEGRKKVSPKPLPEMVAAHEKRGNEALSANQSSFARTADRETQDLAQSISEETDVTEDLPGASDAQGTVSAPEYEMRESRVPSTRFGRLWQYGGLATSMAFGAVGESFRRVTGGGAEGSLLLSEANMNRLVAKLSRMRGAALKLGQMMSFQDSKVLPATINTVLQRVQDSADYMPSSQRDRVLERSLGEKWRDLFSNLEEKPFAAASIGQVHRATLASNGKQVAVKIQYPGVRDSIDSDLNNLSLLLTASRLLPPGLYLDKTIANARTELGWECDYVREADACRRFKELVADETDIFAVPEVYAEASGPDVLTAEYMNGTAVTKIKDLSQEERDWIGTQILRLCLRELMEWRFMQTDPNWTNFLYNRSTRRLELLDFGASREFPQDFVEPYVALLIAASRGDRDSCRDLSIRLGYLTGHESQDMLKAHVDSILTLAEPFFTNAPAVYDFKGQTITDRVRSNIGLMLKERLAPPPEETYSLHRKLSGAFLLCSRLESRIKTRDMFANAIEVWEDRQQKVPQPIINI